MKRLLFLISLFALLGSSVEAQTQFRKLTHDEGLAAAKAEGKLLFIDFYTQWCGPCKSMAKNIFPQKEVGDFFNEKFVCLQLDAENPAEGKNYTERYDVKAYPTFVIVDPALDNKVIYNHAGGNSDPKAFVEQIRMAIQSELSPEKLAQRYSQGERSAEVISAYASYKLQQANNTRQPDIRQQLTDEAHQMVNEYWNTLKTDEERLAEENIFCYSLQYIQDTQDPKLLYAAEHINDFGPNGQSYVGQQLNYFNSNLILYYLSGEYPVDAQSVQHLKDYIAKYDVDPEGKLVDVYAILDAKVAGNAAQYIEACDKHFINLDDAQQQYLLLRYDQQVDSADPAVLQQASTFMRKCYQTVDPSTIYFSAFSLMNIEKRMKGEPTGH